MDIYDAIRSRRSIRQYHEKPIDSEVLDRVLEAGRLAPSAKNRQEWRFVVVEDYDLRQALARAANQPFIGKAGVVMACCAWEDDYRMRCGQRSYPIDVAIAIDHMTLAAVAEGLGTCWIGAFQEDEVKRILAIPEEFRVVELLALGHPSEKPEAKPRLSREEVFCKDRWALAGPAK